MISDHARSVVERIFADAMRMHLPVDPSHRLDLTPAGPDAPLDHGSHQAMVVTSSSFQFRLLTVFHLAGGGLSSYFARGREGVAVTEAFAEVANLCCGAINRELSRYVPHLGMSTPYVLDGRCVDFAADLRPHHLARYALAINDSVRMGATLCLSGTVDIDFPASVRVAAEESASTGDLELF